ncbi:MAG: tetraacyldisaccharide 4'-kinase [Planctomycetes bacterium]|nr:tetraacyldisaccharide 4'-kinase [Planctomycetota bacterium]
MLASVPYGWAVRLRNFLYDMSLLPTRTLPAPAVCIGNLTAGGTGKTPAVAWVAGHFRRRGVPVAVLRRGYRRGRSEGPAEESRWLSERLAAGVEVIEDPDRVAAGRRAVEHGAEVLVLDDGFQHRRARRDLDVVLVDAADPFGGGRLLPWGLLREPEQGIRRAGVIVLTRTDHVSPAECAELEARLRALHPDAPLVRAVHAPRRLMDGARGEALDLKQLVGCRLRAFAGLARPEAFFRTLEDLGADVVQRLACPDHHDYTSDEVAGLLRVPGPPWITTEKDWVKIRDLGPVAGLWVLGVDFEVLSGDEALRRALDGILTARAEPPAGRVSD